MTPTTMRAIYTDVYGPPLDVLHLKTVPVPTALPAGHALVRVRAAATHAGDWHLIRGTPFFIRLMFGGLFKPTIHIPGCELSGTIVQLQPSSSPPASDSTPRFAVDDSVMADVSDVGFGAFAEFISVPLTALVAKPNNVSFSHAAASCTSALAALQAVRDHAKVQPGDNVLVHGASGGVGSFAVQLCRHYGARVSAVCHGSKKARIVATLKPDAVIDYTNTDVRSLDEQFDVVIDTACFKPVSYFAPVLRKGGQYLVIGGSTKRFLQIALFGSCLSWWHGIRARFVESKVIQEDLATIAQMLSDRTIVPLIDRHFTLDDTPHAVAHVEGRSVVGKVVIDVTSDPDSTM